MSALVRTLATVSCNMKRLFFFTTSFAIELYIFFSSCRNLFCQPIFISFIRETLSLVDHLSLTRSSLLLLLHPSIRFSNIVFFQWTASSRLVLLARVAFLNFILQIDSSVNADASPRLAAKLLFASSHDPEVKEGVLPVRPMRAQGARAQLVAVVAAVESEKETNNLLSSP